MRKLFKVLLISAGLMSVVACSTTNPDGGANVSDGTPVAMNGEAGSGAVASGAGDSDNFNGDASASADDSASNIKKMQVNDQKYYFDFNSYDINTADMPSIKVQADYLAAHPKAHVLLAGNTDERGSREYNIALGNKRAQSVAQRLKAGGVANSQITTVSYGAEKPAALGHDEAAWAENRRVDFNYQTPINNDSK